MALNIGSAAAAYARQARSAGFGSMEARGNDPGKSFVDMLGQAHKTHLAGVQVLGDLDKVREGSGQPIQPPDHHHVAFP